MRLVISIWLIKIRSTIEQKLYSEIILIGDHEKLSALELSVAIVDNDNDIF